MIKGILFDMDGVLIDSEPAILHAALRFFKDYNVVAEPSDFIPFIGRGDKLYVVGPAEKHNLHLDFEKIRDPFYQYYKQEVVKQAAIPGVKEFIENLKKAGIKTVLASSATKEKILINLSALNIDPSSFEALISGEHVTKTKPDPEIYLMAASSLKLKPQDCLVVEDALNGIVAGKATGAMVCALNTSFTDSEVRNAGCDISITDLSSFNTFSTEKEFQKELERLKNRK